MFLQVDPNALIIPSLRKNPLITGCSGLIQSEVVACFVPPPAGSTISPRLLKQSRRRVPVPWWCPAVSWLARSGRVAQLMTRPPCAAISMETCPTDTLVSNQKGRS